MNKQNLPPSNNPIQSSINIWAIIGTIIITALVVGGGIYAWQEKKINKINNQNIQTQKTTIKKTTIDKQTKTTKPQPEIETPEIKKNTVVLPAGVQWLTYSDDDLSFVYPKTFLGTPLQDPLDENIGRTEWKISKQNNTIYIRPNFESPAAEFGSTYEITIIDNQKELEEMQATIQSGSLTKNFCIPSKYIQLPGYEVCIFEQKVNEGLGRTGKYYVIRSKMKDGNQPLPWIYIYDQADGMYSDYITSVLIPSLKIK